MIRAGRSGSCTTLATRRRAGGAHDAVAPASSSKVRPARFCASSSTTSTIRPRPWSGIASPAAGAGGAGSGVGGVAASASSAERVSRPSENRVPRPPAMPGPADGPAARRCAARWPAQSQPLAAIPLRVVQLVELPEHPLLFGRRDARPGIADQDAHAAAPMPAADQHAAAPGMRDGVADEIAQDALQQHRIRIHHRLAGPDPQRQAFLHRLRRILGPQLLQQRIEREPLAPGLDHAGVQPGDIEQGIEQMPHRRRRAGDVVHQVAAVRGEFLVGQQAQEQADREHGLAQVMAGGGQEARFFQVAALGRLLRAAPAPAAPDSRSPAAGRPGGCDACGA